jgi:Histone methylation protein DOT1
LQEDEVGVQDDWALPSRYLQKWRLFRKVIAPDQRNGKPLWFPESDFPQNDDMSEYALEGYLVAPNLKQVRLRLDQIETLYFDRYPQRRGWWVSAHDGKELTVYYRLMEPDETVSMSDPAPAPEDAPHLKQRALLAVLSSLLSVGLPIADEDGSSHSDLPQDVTVDPFLDRVRAEGVDVLPILRMFSDKCKTYLKCLFLYSDEESTCTLPLEDLPRKDVTPTALLKATFALERVAGIRPWGVPAVEKARKRKKSPSRSPTSHAKKMCFETSPVAREVSEGSSSPTESSQSSVASQSSNRQSDARTRSPSNLPSTLTKRRHDDLLSVVEFKGLFSDDEFEDLEECNDVRFGGGSSEHQYGRILPDAADCFFRLMELSRDDSFVDLGSGIGSLVLQAAYTIGCPSRGIEIVKGRHEAALELQEYTVGRVEELNLCGIHPGTVVFVNQDLISQDASSVLQEAIRDAISPSRGGKLKAFVNNYEGIMGDRSPGARTGMSPEHYIAGQFASWPPGSQLVTISPLRGMGIPIEQALTELRKHELMKGDPMHSSFFTLEEIYVGPQNEVASWSSNSGCTKDVFAYRYTRIEQDSDSDNSGGTNPDGSFPSVFLCSNPTCPLAKAGTSLPAVRLDDQPKSLRRPLQRWL